MDESKFIGCIVGLAVGDALGYPAEFRRRAQLLKEIGPAGIEDFIALSDARFSRPFFAGSPDHPPGTFTDDTQMTIAIAEALLTAGNSNLDDLANALSSLARSSGSHAVLAPEVWTTSAHDARAVAPDDVHAA